MSEIRQGFLSKLQRTATCWLWIGTKFAGGYGQFRIGKKKARKSMLAHRYSYELFIGPIPQKMFVCHSCDVRTCVNPSHLFLGTAADNQKDVSQKGRLARKLTAVEVREIRALYKHGGSTLQQLSAIFGVHTSMIHTIVRGKTWRYA